MSETAAPAPAGTGPAPELRADSIGLFGTTSSTLANIAPAAGALIVRGARGASAAALSQGLED